jgi:hypothetical protein
MHDAVSCFRFFIVARPPPAQLLDKLLTLPSAIEKVMLAPVGCARVRSAFGRNWFPYSQSQ